MDNLDYRRSPKSNWVWIFIMGMAAHMPMGVIFFQTWKGGLSGILWLGPILFGILGGVVALSLGVSAWSFQRWNVNSGFTRVLLQSMVFVCVGVSAVIVCFSLGWLYLQNLPRDTQLQRQFQSGQSLTMFIYFLLYLFMNLTALTFVIGIGVARELAQAYQVRHPAVRVTLITLIGAITGWGWLAFLALGVALGLEGLLGPNAWRVAADSGEQSKTRKASSGGALAWIGAMMVIGLCLALGVWAAIQLRAVNKLFLSTWE